jgi:hypothetical protein
MSKWVRCLIYFLILIHLQHFLNSIAFFSYVLLLALHFLFPSSSLLLIVIPSDFLQPPHILPIIHHVLSYVFNLVLLCSLIFRLPLFCHILSPILSQTFRVLPFFQSAYYYLLYPPSSLPPSPPPHVCGCRIRQVFVAESVTALFPRPWTVWKQGMSACLLLGQERNLSADTFAQTLTSPLLSLRHKLYPARLQIPNCLRHRATYCCLPRHSIRFFDRELMT